MTKFPTQINTRASLSCCQNIMKFLPTCSFFRKKLHFLTIFRLYSIRILKLKKSYYPNFCLGSQLVLKKTFTERLAWLSVAETKGGSFSHAKELTDKRFPKPDDQLCYRKRRSYIRSLAPINVCRQPSKAEDD